MNIISDIIVNAPKLNFDTNILKTTMLITIKAYILLSFLHPCIKIFHHHSLSKTINNYII